MAIKRVYVSPDVPRPTKVPKYLNTRINKLSRAIAAQKPELREESYFVTIPANATAPIPLLVRASMESLDAGASEIRLHRIRTCHVHTVGDPLWHTLYSPKSTASPTACLYNAANAFDVSNFLATPDMTQSTVYKNLNLTGKIESSLTQQLISMDQRFSIPKKIRFDNEILANGNPIDQFYYIGGNRSISVAKTLCVNIWYTCT